jgi:hypothetical protein
MLMRLAFVVTTLVAVATSQAGYEWMQSQEGAIYKHAGVTSAGFAVAGTSLTQPLEAELFELFAGNLSLLSAADTNPQDHDTVFAVDIARAGTSAVAVQSARGNFTSIVYKWDACPDPPDCAPRADWQQVVNTSEITQLGISSDGTVVALVGTGNMSYYTPPNAACTCLLARCTHAQCSPPASQPLFSDWLHALRRSVGV